MPKCRVVAFFTGGDLPARSIIGHSRCHGEGGQVLAEPVHPHAGASHNAHQPNRLVLLCSATSAITVIPRFLLHRTGCPGPHPVGRCHVFTSPVGTSSSLSTGCPWFPPSIITASGGTASTIVVTGNATRFHWVLPSPGPADPAFPREKILVLSAVSRGCILRRN